MMPESTSRIPESTAPQVNAQIRQAIQASVRAHAALGSRAIEQRLADLRAEWDIERALFVNAGMVALLGLSLGAFVSRKWLLLPTAVAAFLVEHGVQGWCPPMAVLRRLGFRTRSEIDYERYALKALRGDFAEVRRTPEQALAAVMR